MTDAFRAQALSLAKARLHRLQEDTSLDSFLTACIDGAAAYLADRGIHLDEANAHDLQVLVNEAVFSYGSREKPGPRPDWLRQEQRERWLRDPYRGVV